MQHNALSGITILEYAQLISGPYCGKLFADLGAKVIKIEDPPGGDEARRRGPFLSSNPNPERSALFMYLNTNKLGITLDLKTAPGIDTLQTLIEDADVFIEDLAPQTTTDMGLAYENLQIINPQLIVTSITPFGQTGPYACYKTYPLNTTFSGGLGYSTPDTPHYRNREPVKPGGMLGEYGCGLHAAVATLAALYSQRMTGLGQHVDVSKQEVVVTLNRLTAAQYANMRHLANDATTRNLRNISPLIPCKDGHVVISMPETHQWHACIRLMGNPKWARNELYDDDSQRVAHFEKRIKPRLTEWALNYTREEIYHRGQAYGCPVSPVLSAKDVVKSDQLQSRKFFIKRSDRLGNDITFPGAPYKLSKTPWAMQNPAPSLGQHNEMILSRQKSGAFPESETRGRLEQQGVVTYPLEGIRITDFTWAWAGAHATELLAMLGAQVIKVESRSRLDHSRFYSITTGEFYEDPELSPAFNDMNLNKLSVTLNLHHPKAVELTKKLIKISDVVAQNMRPGVMDRLGLGYDVLRELRPDIIMLSSSALGMTGPQREYVGYATNFAATSGLAYITGHPNGPPLIAGGEADLLSATTSAHAILAALVHRRRTGEGQHIDLSSSEAISVLLGDVLVDYCINNRSQTRKGNRDESMAPHNCYPCKGEDKWISIAIGTNEEWQAFCQVVGHLEWRSDVRFADRSSRWHNQDELDPLVASWTAEHTPHEAMQILQEAGIAAVPFFNSDDLCTDPHLRHRNYWVEVDHPRIGRQTVAAPPWKLSKTPAKITHYGPLLGEHNEYVFGELLGLDKTEITSLIEDQAIY